MAVGILLLSSNGDLLVREIGDANSLDSSSPKILKRVGTLPAALHAASEYLPEVILIDAATHGIDPALACRELAARQNSAKIVVMAARGDDRTLIRALIGGASGYIRTNPTTTTIKDCIQTILRNRIYISPLQGHWGRASHTGTCAAERHTELKALSPRETEVLTMLANGMKSREIAEALYISEKTVETHRSHIVKKIGIRSIAGLTKFAVRQGLVTLDND